MISLKGWFKMENDFKLLFLGTNTYKDAFLFLQANPNYKMDDEAEKHFELLRETTTAPASDKNGFLDEVSSKQKPEWFK